MTQVRVEAGAAVRVVTLEVLQHVPHCKSACSIAGAGLQPGCACQAAQNARWSCA